MKQVIVLGAGIVGVTTAYYLSRAGYQVTVIEQADAAGLQTSFANGGQLSYSYTEPLAQPYILSKLPALLFSYYAPLAIKPTLSPRFLQWLYHFLRNCTHARAEANMFNVLNLGLYAREQIHQLIARETDLEFDYLTAGKMYLYLDAKDFEQGAQRAASKNGANCQQHVLTPEQCLEREPALADIAPQLVGGVYSPLDESGDAHRFTQNLARICATRYGVKFLYNTAIQSITAHHQHIHAVQTAQGEMKADIFVVTLGIASPRVLQALDLTVPIYPMKGYSLTMPATEHSNYISLTDVKHRLVFSRLGNRLRIAGIAELGYDDDTILPRKAELVARLAKMVLPNGGNYQDIQYWTGVRPQTPDSVPIIGETRYNNLFLNTGHGMLGWTLSCGSAAILADLISGNTPAVQAEGFSLNRFS